MRPDRRHSLPADRKASRAQQFTTEATDDKQQDGSITEELGDECPWWPAWRGLEQRLLGIRTSFCPSLHPHKPEASPGRELLSHCPLSWGEQWPHVFRETDTQCQGGCLPHSLIEQSCTLWQNEKTNNNNKNPKNESVREKLSNCWPIQFWELSY